MGWTKQEQAAIVAKRLTPGMVINLGVGMPTLVAAAVDDSDELTFHCENGLIGYRSLIEDEPIDPDIIDAACKPIQLVTGAAVVAHDVSFAIARGGRLDVTILGAHQVSANGDLANWSSGQDQIAGVGGAMDLAVGAKSVIVMTKHTDKKGNPKIVEHCTLPLTACECVDLIVSNLAVMRVTSQGLLVEELAPGVTPAQLVALTAAPLHFLKESDE
jgi:3-oxoacid CoA-transferase B subunit